MPIQETPDRALDFAFKGINAPNASLRLWRAGPITAVRPIEDRPEVELEIQFFRNRRNGKEDTSYRTLTGRLAAYENGGLRMVWDFNGEASLQSSPMLEHEGRPPKLVPLLIESTGPEQWTVATADGAAVWVLSNLAPERAPWSDLIVPPHPVCTIEARWEKSASIPWQSCDTFVPHRPNSVPLGFVTEDDQVVAALFALEAAPQEHFVGTGERFRRLDLAGQSIQLYNRDALGVNNRDAYKNVPLFLSSRGYGVFLHTTHTADLSFADESTRAVQGRLYTSRLDLFLLPGPRLQDSLRRYHEFTGTPGLPPRWSFGIWMSRMTYFTAAETEEIGARLRAEDLPCDVIHVDTGWFEADWDCDWEFGPAFPEPEEWVRRMQALGYRVTLWQTPTLKESNKWVPEARAEGHLAPAKVIPQAAGSDFAGSDSEDAGQLDFSRPATIAWYQERLRRLLLMGIAAIKTDFGETVDPKADYHGMSIEALHNLYPFLYQKAAYEVTREIHGAKEALIWARSSWAGCQRFPLHWGGDAAATWDGLAGTLRGGLHFGLSGFPFWSHDVPGFHNLPDFMNTALDETLYVRWTQFGVFSSHIRYHGTSPREPYHFPAILDIVRKWWKLRYALLPYFWREAEKVIESGLPFLRALVFHHQDDPACWHIDDQFYCGDDLLVAPFTGPQETRRVYLPVGNWVSFWTGETFVGGCYLTVQHGVEHLPLFVRSGSEIPVNLRAIQHTDEFDDRTVEPLVFDSDRFGPWHSNLRAFLQL